jgi:acetyltransferase
VNAAFISFATRGVYERFMPAGRLDALFAPRSVVLVGASDRPGSIGAVTLRNLQAGGFAGPLYVVNPAHRTLGGLPVYPAIADLPGVPDLALIATPAPRVTGIVADLAAAGTRVAIVIAAGFG